MSGSDTQELGTPTTSNLGGKRIPGQRSALSQNIRDANIRNIKELWGVSEFVNIFPVNIRPKGDLGDSAISNLRAIAKKMPNLGAAHALMISECVDASGRASSLSFKHTTNILSHLKAMEKMVKSEEETQKAKVLTPDEIKKQEEAAKKDKIYGKPPRLPFSKEAISPGEECAMKSGHTPGPALAAFKETAANISVTGKTTQNSNATPAKKTFPDKTKAATPASKIGIVLDTPSVPKVRQRKEPPTGLHAPSRQDVAPFSKTLATAKSAISNVASTEETFPKEATSDKATTKEANLKGAISQKATFKEATPKKTISKEAASKKAIPMKVTSKEALSKKPTREETLTRKIGPKNHLAFGRDDQSIDSRGFGSEIDDLFEEETRQQGLMTDDNGIPIEPANSRSKIPSKRPVEDAEDLSYGGLPFTKESIMAELNFKKRVVEKVGHTTAVSTPSEAETEIDIESVPGLLRDNVAITFGFEEAAEAVATKSKVTDAKVADAKLAGAKAAGAQAVGAKTIVAKAAGAKVADTKAADLKVVGVKAIDAPVAGVKTAGIKAADVKATVIKTADAKTVRGKAIEPKDKVVEENAMQAKVFNSKAMTDGKPAKENVTKSKTAEKKTENVKAGQKKRVEQNSDGGKDHHGPTDKGSKKRKLVPFDEESDVQDDVHVNLQAIKAVEKRKILKPIGIHPKLDVPFTTHFDKPSKDIASLWSDREKALASIPQTPTSPIDSEPPICESNLFNPARPSPEIPDSRLSRTSVSLFPVGKAHTDPKLSQDHPATSTNLTSKTHGKSTVPENNFTMERSIDDARVDSEKDILEYSFSELVELSRAKEAQSTKAGKQGAMGLKDPMDYTIRELRECLEERRRRPAKKLPRGEVPGSSRDFTGKISTPATALPKLPETLVARAHADRALITSVPGIIRAYVEELRAIVADGKGPDGDLLSMIIVNKYGYFLEHVEKLDKDLKSLYYEALERNP